MYKLIKNFGINIIHSSFERLSSGIIKINKYIYKILLGNYTIFITKTHVQHHIIVV